jgi:hypothetical protein
VRASTRTVYDSVPYRTAHVSGSTVLIYIILFCTLIDVPVSTYVPVPCCDLSIILWPVNNHGNVGKIQSAEKVLLAALPRQI